MGRESQLSAIRSIKQEFVTAEKKLKELVTSAAKEHAIHMDFHLAIGPIKAEISNFINHYQP